MPSGRLSARGALSLLALSVLAGMPAASAQTPAPGVAGIWIDDEGRGGIEITACGASLCGRIVWLKDEKDGKGRPLTDQLNPDRKLRGRPICGLQVLGDLKVVRGGWDQGWIYDPEEGKTYNLAVRLKSADVLEIHGYAGLKVLGEKFDWTRAPATLGRCAGLPPPSPPAPAAAPALVPPKR